jgi:predicted ATPase
MIAVFERVHSEMMSTNEVRETQFKQTGTLLTVFLAIIESLQDLHDMLIAYNPPKIVHPTLESLRPQRHSLLDAFDAIFSRKSTNKAKMEIPEAVPKGIYMYGDVGSGKTMMMDMFFETLPPNIKHKTRIHFHNFMQEVHRELHKMKMRYGNDFDAIPFVAAQIAERSTVLCFDEFQTTDVADAMILRRWVIPKRGRD